MATNEQIDALFDAMFVRNENKLAVKLKKNFSNIAKDMREAYLMGGRSMAESVIEQNKDVLTDILVEAYMRSGEDSARFTLKTLDEELEDEDDLIAEAMAFLFLWSEPQAKQSSTFITATTHKILNETFDKIQNATLSREQFIKLVTSNFNKLNQGRVSIISTTEAGTAVSVGQQKTAEAMSGISLELLKSWRSQRDREVRDTHIRADLRYTEEPIPLENLYQVGAGIGMYPRDPNLPLNERVGCRCYQRFKTVRHNSVGKIN